ncbi:MAG TPA: sialidase family protein [Cryobacterium sp.]|nr:sialidase family protein [Cryobacterium sp.]
MTTPRRTLRLGGAAVITVGLAAALAGCAPSPAAPATGTSTTTTAAFEHIHGLGADPSTGATYAGTHQGVWQIPTGLLPDSYLAGAPDAGLTRPTRHAGPVFDAMGFTVAAPGLLLASGHPGSDTSTLSAPNVGLISSTDAAATWTNVSLAGETDFHDLDAVTLPSGALRVYGYDAADGLVSISDDDGATWASGAAVALRDLAADPANPEQVYATTEDGLARSDDAGRTFAPVPGAPMLYLIDVQDAAAGGSIVGIDPGGVLWHQEARGGTWTRGGQTEGSPEAFTFVGGSAPWLLAADQRGVVASDDFGLTWTVLVAAQA